MNIIKKFFLILQKFFVRDKLLQLEAPKAAFPHNSRQDLLESLQFSSDSNTKKVIEILICPGTGLGIQGKISY